MAKLIPTLAHINPVHFALAVLKVYRLNEQAWEAKVGFAEANADLWGINSVYRGHLYANVAREWTALTGIDHREFPFTEDAVVKMYFRFRKRSAAEVAAWDQELTLAR